jgi:Right handed beta helix region
MKRYFLLIAAAALAAAGLTFTSVPAHAGTVHIVLPGQSIQAAVDAASPGDTVQLVRGTYQQSVTISTDGITLRGVGAGPDGTVLLPPSQPPPGFCASVPPDGPTHGGGICVFGTFDPETGAVVKDVAGVHITGIRVQDEPGDGVVGYGTTGLRVSHVAVVNSGVYGIVVIASQHATVSGNLVDGVQKPGGAGMFLGFTSHADLLVTGNKVRNAALGIFLQDIQDVRVMRNDATGNCTGALVLDDNHPQDGQPPGSVNGDIVIAGNHLTANNAPCLGHPAIQGTGLLMVGTRNTTVVHNTVTANSGAQALSGGIVLVSAVPFGGLDEGSDVIAHNSLAGNAPMDVMWDQHGSDVAFSGNHCGTSSPAPLCAGG